MVQALALFKIHWSQQKMLEVMSVGERHLRFCFYCIFFVLYYIYRKQSIFFKYYRRILIYFLWIFIENNLFSPPVDSWVAVMVTHFSLFLLLPPALVAKKPQKQNQKKKVSPDYLACCVNGIFPRDTLWTKTHCMCFVMCS